MLVGSLAANFHGIPRSTRDADFVVQPPPDGLQRLAAQLPPELRLRETGCLRSRHGNGWHLVTLKDSSFVCELFELSDDPHDRARFARRMSARVLERDAFVAFAEDMIITKLRWATGANRIKDRDDIRNMLAVQGSEMDWEYLDRWSTTHETAALLRQIRDSIPRS